MKIKIEMTPDGPELSEIQGKLDTLNPPLSDRIKSSVMEHAKMVREKLHFNAVNDTGANYHQSQTLSDANHIVTIIGRMHKETLLSKIKRFF